MTRTILVFLVAALMVTPETSAQNPFSQAMMQGFKAGHERGLLQSELAFRSWQVRFEAAQEQIRWLKQTAIADDTMAQFRLGEIYYYGEDVPQNVREAAYWFRKAAEHGHVEAQGLLGMIYYSGVLGGHTRMAVDWWTKAAEQGDVGSQALLDIVQYTGLDYPSNSQEAFVFFALLKMEGFAVDNEIDEARAQLTEDEITTAQTIGINLRAKMKAERAQNQQ